MNSSRNRWAAPGDVNAFFGLMLDNIADLVLTVSLLHGVFQFPIHFALSHMAPGTAVGVLIGDLLFFWMALRLAKKTGRSDITAMPLGLDTPSTIGMVFFVLGPAFVAAKQTMTVEQAAFHTWHIGICAMFISGVFKLVCSLGSHWVRSVLPRAGLLGSLAALALVLISFLPLIEIVEYPVAGMAALAIILVSLVARTRLPFRIPGALGALLVGAAVYYLMQAFNMLGGSAEVQFDPQMALAPTGWLEAFRFEWVGAFRDTLPYLPLVIPFALATVIGGIDCTESAAAAGDEFPTGQIIAVEGLATLAASLCGGVIQTTPYIGHPAYKAMGGRAAYTLATALFIGGAGLIGYFGYLYAVIPKAAVFPILVFIGLEITAQSFQATPKKHYAAVALACVPALAALVLIFVDNLQGQYIAEVQKLNQNLEQYQHQSQQNESQQQAWQAIEEQGKRLEALAGNPAKGTIGQAAGPLGEQLQTLRVLSGGFVVTSLLWASLLAAIIDRRFLTAAAFCTVAAVCALFGVIHSPLQGSPLINPLSPPVNLPATSVGQTPLMMAAAYALVAILLVGFGKIQKPKEPAAIQGEC